MYNDCRDVASSTLKRFRAVERNNKEWIENLSMAETIAKRWVQAIELMESHAEKLHIIRYENLIKQPDQELEALGGWLGVNPSGFSKEVIQNTGIGKYKEGLSKEELATIMNIAGPTMARLGYI